MSEIDEQSLEAGSFIPLRVVEVEMRLPSQNPVLVLEEIDWPKRVLQIPIGLAEGVAIAYGLRGQATPRPLTHALFAQVLEALGATLEVVRITDSIGDAYAGEIVLSGPYGLKVLKCRPSDAIALALRCPVPVPITVAAAVLDQKDGGASSG